MSQKHVNHGIFRPLLVFNGLMKQFFGENSLWTPADYFLGNGIIGNCTVGIHMSEFRPENEILG